MAKKGDMVMTAAMGEQADFHDFPELYELSVEDSETVQKALAEEKEQREFDARIRMAQTAMALVCPPAGTFFELMEHGPDIIADGIYDIYKAESSKEAIAAARTAVCGLARLLIKVKLQPSLPFRH